jgi:hypothetical protein
MTAKFDSNDSHIDLRDVTDRVEELRSEREDHEATDDDADGGQIVADKPWADVAPDDAEELTALESLLSELAGYGGDHQWEGTWYPAGLIHEDAFVDAMKELVEDIGDLPNDMPSYVVVDWDATAENLRVDYSSVEFDGATYWYR